MNPIMFSKLKQLLILHEGKENYPYTDTVGKITIGVGYNLTDRGLPDSWIEQQCSEDINYFYLQLSIFPWFQQLNESRQICLVDMCFMGFKKFLSFKKMLSALENHDYIHAAFEMLDSKWAMQVGKRAEKLANIMRTGEL